MALIKVKDAPPFLVLTLFGQSYDKYRHAEQIFLLLQEIEFKWSAVIIAFNLILGQEKVIQELHKDTTPKVRSYEPEVKQMAYLGFFLDTIYALTERCSHVTKIFHNGKLKEGFNRQRQVLLKKPEIDPPLAKLLSQIKWYALFREVRVQHSHYGSSVLAFGYDKEPQTGSSQLIIEIGGGEEKKVLTGKRYNFDLRKTAEIKEGIEKFIQQWALVLLKKLDTNATISRDPKQKEEIPLEKFMEGRS
ncbi:MAG TPA: hypothetical protein VMW41_05765 [Candidatus Bathyarchaeia archaeon]|nr:hypothetical protein [Candidatus Bathyarchaeia archaeon]